MKYLQQEHIGGTGLPKYQWFQFQLEPTLEGARDVDAAHVGRVPDNKSREAGAYPASVPRKAVSD